MGRAVYAEAGRAVKNIGKTVGLINRAIHMDGTEAQTMARKIRDNEGYNNEAKLGELYVQMLRDGGDVAAVLEGTEVEEVWADGNNNELRKSSKKQKHSPETSDTESIKNHEGTAEWNEHVGVAVWETQNKRQLTETELAAVHFRNEVGYVYDEKGMLIIQKEGERSLVEFEEAAVKKMKNGVLTHNHPGPDYGCFSPSDINMLRHGALSEVRLVTRVGVYRIQQPLQWPERISSLEEVSKEYYNIENSIEGEIFAKAAMGQITMLEAENMGQEMTVRELCRMYGIPFTFEPWSGT